MVCCLWLIGISPKLLRHKHNYKHKPQTTTTNTNHYHKALKKNVLPEIFNIIGKIYSFTLREKVKLKNTRYCDIGWKPISGWNAPVWSISSSKNFPHVGFRINQSTVHIFIIANIPTIATACGSLINCDYFDKNLSSLKITEQDLR